MGNRMPRHVVVDPDLTQALGIFREGVESRRFILLIGSCSVDYRGRAESKLGSGERLLLVKSDGAVLVHRAVGYEPVNWQPGGSYFKTEITDEGLVVQAIRRKPREILTLTFSSISLAVNLALADDAEFLMYASEEDMQKAILKRPSLIEAGLQPITYEKKVEPGFVDVFGVDRNGKLVVIEIKRKTATRDAALQLASYVESVRTTSSRDVRGILVAPNLAKETQKLCAALNLEYKLLDPRKCIELLRKRPAKRISEFLG